MPDLPVDAEELRVQVRSKYREVAVAPGASYHFHTGRALAARLGYDAEAVAALPDAAVESFAGVGNPFSLRTLRPGERVVDVGSGGGFDSFVAAANVGREGRVVGVDMTEEMLAKSRATATALAYEQVEFRDGLAEELPVEDGWADVVISNGVLNLCADKRAVFAEIWRVLRPGGWLQLADIANGRPVPAGGVARHRPVDRLNRWWAAPCGLAGDARGHRLRRGDDRTRGRHVRRSPRAGERKDLRGVRLRLPGPQTRLTESIVMRPARDDGCRARGDR